MKTRIKIKRILFILSTMAVMLFAGCGKGSEWTNGEITINGTEVTLPFSYQELDKISCQTADQYYNNISDQYVFNAGEREPELTVVDTVNNGYIILGCVNVGTEACTLPNVMVYRVGAEARNEKTRPNILLPGNISWGAALSDIEKAYGDASEEGEKTYDAETQMTKLLYRSDQGDGAEDDAVSLTLYVHDEKGLQKLYYCVPCTERNSGDETEAIENRIVSEQPVSADLAKLPEQWQQPAVQFGDRVYGFPLTVANLQDLGFRFKEDPQKEILNPENTQVCQMISEKYGEITVDLVNLDENLRRPDTVWVDELELNVAKLNEPSQIMVTGGVGFGDTPDQIAKVFRDGPEAVTSEYKTEKNVTGTTYEYSLADVATEQSLYRFGVDPDQGVQMIMIKKHRTVFPKNRR